MQASNKIAIIHDWLTGMRGGEKVLEAVCELFPRATLFTLFHVKGSTSDVIERMAIRTSFLQGLPLVKSRYRYYLPLFPRAVESLDLKNFDLVISSSHCAAKGVRPEKNALHLSYVHAPMRYMWDMYDDYFGPGRAGVATKTGAALFKNYLRRWDVESSRRVNHFAANSKHVAEKIKALYKRDAEVIYPPVDVTRFKPGAGDGGYYLALSAFAPYKRIDLAVEAFKILGADYRLKVIGTGQDEARLKKIAGQNVEFLGWQSDGGVVKYMSGARALVFPGVEDFGITPVEALASGRPVIAFGRGGALETITPLGAGRKNAATGVFFDRQTPDSLAAAIKTFEASMKDFDTEAIRQSALRFDKKVFIEKFGAFVDEKLSLDARAR